MNKRKLYFEKLQWLEPEQIFVKLFGGKKQAFWLDDGSEISKKQFCYMGVAEKSITKGNKREQFQKDILIYLKKEIAKWAAFDFPELPFNFAGGYVGYFGYETLSENPRNNERIPNARFLYVSKFLAFDHRKKEVYIACISKTEEEAGLWFGKIKKELLKTSEETAGVKNLKSKINNPVFVMSRSRRQYLQDIKTCQEYLAYGEAYQICLTNQISVNLKTNSLELFLTLRKQNPAPFSAYLNFGDLALISSSPELFLNTDTNGIVISKPMKGTSRRGETFEEDFKLRNKLGKTEKDFAENAMIVDLVRNDLGRVCEIGSVEVINPLSVETYKTVHQLVSTVRGKLKKGKTIIDAVEAAFPGGSMTGAPKIRVMEILAKLEKQKRGIYSGCFGFLSLSGSANLAMTIRTIIAEENKLSFGSGGAILIDSNPEAEYEEMLLKTKALIAAIAKTAGAQEYKII